MLVDMKTNSSATPDGATSQAHTAFTLIELLVVIAIIQGKPHTRVRSLTMNNWLGRYLSPSGRPASSPFPGDDQYRINRRYGDLSQPPPDRTFVFIDEREGSINDCVFYVGMGRR